MSRLFLFSNRNDAAEDLHEAFVVADELGRETSLPDDYEIRFVHTKWWHFGKQVREDKQIPFRPVRSDTMATVGHLVRAIKKEYRDLGFAAQLVGPKGVVSGRTRLDTLFD